MGKRTKRHPRGAFPVAKELVIADSDGYNASRTYWPFGTGRERVRLVPARTE